MVSGCGARKEPCVLYTLGTMRFTLFAGTANTYCPPYFLREPEQNAVVQIVTLLVTVWHRETTYLLLQAVWYGWERVNKGFTVVLDTYIFLEFSH